MEKWQKKKIELHTTYKWNTMNPSMYAWTQVCFSINVCLQKLLLISYIEGKVPFTCIFLRSSLPFLLNTSNEFQQIQHMHFLSRARHVTSFLSSFHVISLKLCPLSLHAFMYELFVDLHYINLWNVFHILFRYGQWMHSAKQ